MNRPSADVRAAALGRQCFPAAVLATFLAMMSVAVADERTRRAADIIGSMREQVLARLNPVPAMVVAEIGIGGGWFVVRVAEAVGPKGVIYGTDIDPAALSAMRQRLPKLPPGGRVELRLCDGPRDTALDDLPDGHVDAVLMVDSLCFDASEPRDTNVEYLRRFLRILRPGGRLLHHMDCRCDVSQDAVVALFRDAGFSPDVEIHNVAPSPDLVDADWPCRSDAERERHAFVGIFRKPG